MTRMSKKVNSKKEEAIMEESKEIRKEEPKKKQEAKISFDLYFQQLVKLGKAQKHHKLPMKSFAVQNGVGKEATKNKFEEVFKLY